VPRLVPIDELQVEHREWMSKLARAAEAWVQARAKGLPTEHYDRQMREAEQHSRRLERRMRRRKR
jgi:hypothetical protein